MSTWEKIQYEFYKGNSAIRQIIMINLAAFIFTVFVGVIARLSGFPPEDLLEYFYIPSNIGKLIIRPWTILTNIFFHAGFWHLFGNMILLYFIGRILEDFMDFKKIWKIFLYGGISGALLFVTSYNIFPVFNEVVGYKKLLGASGGVTAILVATGTYLPRYQIRPFGLFNVELRWVALFFVFRDLYMFPVSHNTGGLFAHMGGAIFGLVYVLNLQGRITRPNLNQKPFFWDRHRDERSRGPIITDKKPKPNQEEVDAILDKISQSGYDSLSKHEKEILFKASEVLVEGMARSISQGVAVNLRHHQFDWPLANHAHLPKDAESAKQSVAGQLRRLARERKALGMILMGPSCSEWVSVPPALTQLNIPSTLSMLEKPLRKREAWQVLKAQITPALKD